jgi:hypothetical protein
LHHPHLHCLVFAGGLAPDGSRWTRCSKGFFLSVRVLGKRFRGKYLALLEQAYRDGKLVFHGQLEPLSRPRAFTGLLRQARERNWVVYAKPPFGGPEAALKYLARYTHRIAISNSRILGVDEESVRFTWKDYRNGNQVGASEAAPSNRFYAGPWRRSLAPILHARTRIESSTLAPHGLASCVSSGFATPSGGEFEPVP